MQTLGIGNIHHFLGLEKEKHFHIEVLYAVFRNYFRTEYQNETVLIG